MRRWSHHEEIREVFRRRFASVRGAWCSSTEVSTNRSGRPVVSISGKIGSTPQMRLNEGVTTAEANRVTELEREVRELRRANEIPKLASAFFAQAELDRRLK
ncbi:hypothetical protein C8E08_4735 [Paracidovorax citrulli]|uniref:Transposase n=1 Tax=Paracidovorax citrulli (strain AAC00-1) TaxID=397945 RepID=A1TQ29_PARC0|nr:hypothetical protein Aave_2493 [Paracidovorax citrulli AAC00-1]PVY67296.1 hypothetical protein C8E08_4735 [Paracidovorax citrulli]